MAILLWDWAEKPARAVPEKDRRRPARAASVEDTIGRLRPGVRGGIAALGMKSATPFTSL